jgi:hypothetical protein
MFNDSLKFVPVGDGGTPTAADFILLQEVAARGPVPSSFVDFVRTCPTDQLDEELRIRGTANVAQMLWTKYEALRAEFERYAVDGRALLDAPENKRVAMTGKGDECLPYMKGLDALECLGERLNEVAAERARRRPGSRLAASPWDRDDPSYGRPVPKGRRLATRLRGRNREVDRAWIAKLRCAFPDKPWRG